MLLSKFPTIRPLSNNLVVERDQLKNNRSDIHHGKRGNVIQSRTVHYRSRSTRRQGHLQAII